jgi:hypothetical protein
MAPSVAYVVVRSHGKLFKIQKAPFETEERAYDRAWYIAKELRSHQGSWEEKDCLSHIWANQTYLGMAYSFIEKY